MRLPRQHHFCIWCGRDLDLTGRSVEHLIPAALFGDVTTDDVCASCNSGFGTELDHTFLNDGTTVSAALEAGVQPEDLFANYRARQSGQDGVAVETSVRAGVSAVVPQMDRSDGPMIGDRAGAFDAGQIRGMKRRTAERAQQRRSDLSADEIIRRVEDLYARFLADSAVAEVRDDEIGEGLRRYVIESCPMIVGTQADPDKVTRAVGKVMYEAMCAIVPFRVQQAMRPALSSLKDFVQGTIPGDGFIGNRCLEVTASRRHTITVYGRGENVVCIVVLFGKLEWVFSVKFQHPAGHFAQVTEFEAVLPIEF